MPGILHSSMNYSDRTFSNIICCGSIIASTCLVSGPCKEQPWLWHWTCRSTCTQYTCLLRWLTSEIAGSAWCKRNLLVYSIIAERDQIIYSECDDCALLKYLCHTYTYIVHARFGFGLSCTEILSNGYDVFRRLHTAFLSHAYRTIRGQTKHVNSRIGKLSDCSVDVLIAISNLHCSNYRNEDLFVFDLRQLSLQRCVWPNLRGGGVL